MSKIKTLSAMILLISVVTPVFAQDQNPTRLRRAYDQWSDDSGPFHAGRRARQRANIDNIGRGQVDPSRVGGEDADLPPAVESYNRDIESKRVPNVPPGWRRFPTAPSAGPSTGELLVTGR
jgi:hypothetical protein